MEITKYFLDKIKDISQVEILGSKNPSNRTSIFSLNIKGVHSSDLENIFDELRKKIEKIIIHGEGPC